MPTLRNRKLSDDEILELVSVPSPITSLLTVLEDFTHILKPPSFVQPKLNLSLPLPTAKFHSTSTISPVVRGNENNGFGFYVSREGRFIYQGLPLQHISLNSKHGILLSKLLHNKDNYVADEDILLELNFDDYRNLGYIKRDMKNALKQDGFDIELFRASGQGYKLVALTPSFPQ